MDNEFHSLVYSLASDILPALPDRRSEHSVHFGSIYTVRDVYSMHTVDNASEIQSKIRQKNHKKIIFLAQLLAFLDVQMHSNLKKS